MVLSGSVVGVVVEEPVHAGVSAVVFEHDELEEVTVAEAGPRAVAA